MSLPSFNDRAVALPEANSIVIVRLDGGWLIRTSNNDVPMACRTVHEVMEAVRLFLSDKLPLVPLTASGQEPQIGSNCALSKVDGGWLVTLIYSPQNNVQVLRFTARDVLLVAAGWAGYTEAPFEQTPRPRREDDQPQ